MEILIADRHGEYFIGNPYRHHGLAFLNADYVLKRVHQEYRRRIEVAGNRYAHTGYYFTHHKEIITQQYPDNRDTLELPERFKGEVVMPHNEHNEHRCTGCTACELACPNGTIKVITKFDVTPEGKKKKAIDKLVYHLELCTMCNLCVEACPSDAIKMAQTFEHSVFDRNQLTKVLNNPGSKIMEGVE